jgi:hypothetical protein
MLPRWQPVHRRQPLVDAHEAAFQVEDSEADWGVAVGRPQLRERRLQPELRPLERGDVFHRQADADDLACIVAHGHPAHLRPLPNTLVHGLAGVRDHSLTGEHARAHLLGVLSQEGDHFPGSAADVLRRRRAVELRQPVVDADETEVAVQQGEPYGRCLEYRVQFCVSGAGLAPRASVMSRPRLKR